MSLHRGRGTAIDLLSVSFLQPRLRNNELTGRSMNEWLNMKNLEYEDIAEKSDEHDRLHNELNEPRTSS